MDQRLRDAGEILLYVFLGYLIAVGANKGLGYALGTNYPVMAVVTSSMEHNDNATYIGWFLDNNFTQEDMKDWPFKNGLNTGELVVLYKAEFNNISVGDVIVYQMPGNDPIIHRVVKRENNMLYTKGDNNMHLDQERNTIAPPLKEEYVQGRAVIHVPLLGYVKLTFMKLMGEL